VLSLRVIIPSLQFNFPKPLDRFRGPSKKLVLGTSFRNLLFCIFLHILYLSLGRTVPKPITLVIKPPKLWSRRCSF